MRQAFASRLNAAPGNHAGTCLTGTPSYFVSCSIFGKRGREGALTSGDHVDEIATGHRRSSDALLRGFCELDEGVVVREDLDSIRHVHDVRPDKAGCTRPRTRQLGAFKSKLKGVLRTA